MLRLLVEFNLNFSKPYAMKKANLLTAALGFLLMILFVPSQAQNLNFSSETILYDGKDVRSIIADDFNQDQLPDLAGLVRDNLNGNHIAIFLNTGNGVYNKDPDSIYLVGEVPIEIKNGDLNKDNYPDLVTSLRIDSMLIIWYGRVDGTFGSMDSVLIPIECEYLEIADLNQDGHLDVVVTEDGMIACLFGNGDGSFQDPELYYSSGNPWDVEVADMDDDGFPDILVGHGGGSSLRIHYNDSMGGFSNVKSVYATRPPWYLEVSDFNEDGDLDIAAGSGSYDSENVIILLQDSLGDFEYSAKMSPCGYVRNSTIGDLNGDDHTDILAIDNDGIYAVLGDGTGYVLLIDTIEYDPADFSGDVVHVTDLNGDDKQDIIVGQSDRISIYYNDESSSAVDNLENHPSFLKLNQNYPNPFPGQIIYV